MADYCTRYGESRHILIALFWKGSTAGRVKSPHLRLSPFFQPTLDELPDRPFVGQANDFPFDTQNEDARASTNVRPLDNKTRGIV